jgi:allophanate hydrolase subunit 2
MADGDSTNVSEVIGSIADAVFKPVGEEMGRMMEEGKNSVVGSDDPQSQAKKQQEQAQKKQKEAEQINNIKNYFEELAKQEQIGRQARAQTEQNWNQRNQAEKIQENDHKLEEEKKEASVNQAVYNAERTKEQRNGVGG